MGALVQATANNVIDATLGVATFTAVVGANHVRLMTANGSMTAAGTELATSGSYTAATGITPATFAAAAAGVGASNIALTQTGMPAATIVGVEIWDSAGTPVRRWWGALAASKTTNAGDTFSIASGSLTVSLS